MNWGQSFVNGLATGHSVTQSLIDQYRDQEAKRELKKELENLGANKASGSDAAPRAMPKIDGQVDLSGVGKDGAIDTSPSTKPAEKSWMDSTTSENLEKLAKARGVVDFVGGDVLEQLGSRPWSAEINGVPVENRPTTWKRNDVLPTDTGQKTVRNTFKVGNVTVEDASTPYYKNEIIRQSVEGQAKPKSAAKTRAISVKPGSQDAVKALERYQASSAPQPADQPGTRRALNLRANGTTQDGSLPVSQSYRHGDPQPPTVPTRFEREEQIARDRRAKETETAARVQLDNHGGGPMRPANAPYGVSGRDPSGDFYAQYMRGDLAGGQQGQPSAIRGGASGAQPQTGGQPSAINGGAQASGQAASSGGVSGATQGGGAIDLNQSPSGNGTGAIQLSPGTGNPQIDGQPQDAYTNLDYRNRLRSIAVAEAKYLIQTDPRAGIAAMKNLVMQDAQWELSDMYRGALDGDPQALGKIVEFMNLGQTEGGITVSEDGQYVKYTAPDGSQKTERITPQMVMQTLPMVRATFMMVNGLASDKAAELVQSMQTTALANEKTRSEIARNQAYAGLLGARASGASVPADMKLFATTDAEGNPILVDQRTQRIYDQSSGVLLPRGFTANRMAEVRAKYGDDARLGTAPDGRDVVGTADGRVFDLATGEQINPNQAAATKQGEPGDAEGVSLAVGLIKGLEGFSAEPYSDYAQTSIGYGTRANEGETNITEEEASKRLAEHIQTEVAPKLDSALANAGIDLSPAQKASLISLCYNVGTEKFLRSDAFAALKRGDVQRFVREVADPQMGFTKVRTAMGGLQVSPGLVERRRKEMEAFLA